MIYSLISSLVFAQDVVSLDIIRHGQIGSATPTLVIRVNQDAERLEVALRCGNMEANYGPKSASKGSISLNLDVNAGTHQCNGSLSIEMSDGTTGEMPLSFQVTMHKELQMKIDRDTVDLEEKKLTVQMDRPSNEYTIQVINPNNEEVGQGYLKVDESRNLSPQVVRWTDAANEIAVIRVTGSDIYGFYTQMELLPWHYDIPHEDVVFSSNQSDIQDSEVYKLVDVQTQVHSIVERYSKFAVVNLYVSGYTDTVGDPSHNLKLSEDRARSIALWFKNHGFEGNIYYQGFGESVLAIPTADNVDEVQNRRALYIVAAEAPPVSKGLPKNSWKPLK